MSLPINFDIPKDYFEECVKFFDQYQYLYNFPNTELLVHNILDKIPIEDADVDGFDENFGHNLKNQDNLKELFVKLNRLGVSYDDVEELDYNIQVPLGPKKKHEIVHLCKEINEICDDIGSDVIVDFGSGLGYLDHLLYETKNHKVLGLECNERHYVAAKKRQRKYHYNSISNVKFINHRVDENSTHIIQEYVKDKFGENNKFCMTGLHACADLTIDVMNLFLTIPTAQAMVIMPCCYHKMLHEDGLFKNFPLSSCLRAVFEKYGGCSNAMNIPFLRLAAQPPSVNDNLADLVFNLLSRAVLELYAHSNNYKLKRNKRKAVKTKKMKNNFHVYLQDAVSHGFTLVKKENPTSEPENLNFDTQELMYIWDQLGPVTSKKAAIFIILQNHLQPVIENFILYDRIVFMMENGVQKCCFKKILNANISPRCLALLAFK